MIKKSAYYGIRTDEFERARTRIDKLLGINMKGCDSTVWGAPFYIYRFEDGMEIELIQNWSSYDGEWNFDEYSEFDLIVWVQEANDLTLIHKKLTGDPLLRAELLNERNY